jgi:Glycosyl hydrolase family 30 beta sandwich domain
MITQQWFQPGEQRNEIYPVATEQTSHNPSVTAYAAKRPDGTWAIMLVNKDTENHSVHVDFASKGGSATFSRNAVQATFGVEQYQWTGNSPNEMPKPNRGIAVVPAAPTSEGTYLIPPLSITVIRGTLSTASQAGKP